MEKQTITSKTRSYESLEAYFNFIQNTVGYPALHHHFKNDVVTSQGLQLHLDILEHDTAAPTLVFMPGTAIYALCYAEFLYKLHQEGFNVIGFDPRGHGRSQGTRGDYTVEELIRDARNVISYAFHRYGDNVSFMGSSQGGIVGLYLATVETRLKSVVSQCYADLASPDTAKLTRWPALSRLMRPALNKLGGPISKTYIPVGLYLDFEKIKVKYFGNAKKFMDVDPLVLHTISLRAMKSLASAAPPNPIEGITTPVMVFQGTADSIFPVSYVESIHNRLNCKKRIELFEGCNHAIITEDPDLILPPIVDWLNDVHGVGVASTAA